MSCPYNPRSLSPFSLSFFGQALGPSGTNALFLAFRFSSTALASRRKKGGRGRGREKGDRRLLCNFSVSFSRSSTRRFCVCNERTAWFSAQALDGEREQKRTQGETRERREGTRHSCRANHCTVQRRECDPEKKRRDKRPFSCHCVRCAKAGGRPRPKEEKGRERQGRGRPLRPHSLFLRPNRPKIPRERSSDLRGMAG